MTTKPTREVIERLRDMTKVATYDGASSVVISVEDVLELVTALEETMTGKRTPAEVFPVGDFIQDELDERDWSWNDLAGRTGLSPGEVRGIVLGKIILLAKDAIAIGRAFGCGGEILLQIQKTYKKARKQ